MKQVLLVFLGGGLGSALRYLISKPLNIVLQNFFLGTFLVNIVGCFLIGIILGVSSKNNLLSPNSTLFLATGFCGGFTTFSAFAFEKHSFLKNSELFNFSLYTIASIAIGILAVALGLWISRLGN
ncbi:fluoride efflux transporter CrcB [Flagellimonas flava]|uniref:Fluoride-specific ion channel FluC n=1 Tax=Flagellimonas flava TaxID=570519 RepID=A0A1M5HM93_9FLAO|nr:fluoride efflux transporter CrcB [Allomuricauda flava]SHG17047.1 CrcB protein [Allomuricauda flava]